MKGGVTKKIEDTVKALDQGQLKKALDLTDREGLERHHQFVVDAARTCLSNKSDEEVCKGAMNEARDKIQDTITLPIDDTSLEGVEELLSEEAPAVTPESGTSEKTDEELFEECEECHVAVAAASIAEVCAEHPEEAGSACKLISEKLEDENTEPADWIKTMVEVAEGAQGVAKEKIVASVTELTDYLEKRNSPLLKKLEEGEEETDG